MFFFKSSSNGGSDVIAELRAFIIGHARQTQVEVIDHQCQRVEAVHAELL